jgi:hypothetical protein
LSSKELKHHKKVLKDRRDNMAQVKKPAPKPTKAECMMSKGQQMMAEGKQMMMKAKEMQGMMKKK